METLKKIGAGIAGVGILVLALYLAAFVFVILLIVGGIAAIWLHFKGGKLRKEFEKRQAERHGETIEADYVVVEDPSLDRKPSDRQ